MVRLTLISRLHDGLPLAEGLDSEKDPEVDSYKSQAKVLHWGMHNTQAISVKQHVCMCSLHAEHSIA